MSRSGAEAGFLFMLWLQPEMNVGPSVQATTIASPRHADHCEGCLLSFALTRMNGFRGMEAQRQVASANQLPTMVVVPSLVLRNVRTSPIGLAIALELLPA